MSEESKKTLVPHFIIGAIVMAIILAVVLWPKEPEPIIVVPKTIVIKPKIEPIIEEQPTMRSLESVEEKTEPEVIPEPEPVDISDGAVKTKLLGLSDYEAFARLLINEALLERFVIMTNTLADEEIATNNRVLIQPEKQFRTYTQAKKEWIDPASYKRYAPYVEVFESLETESLVQLYQEYKPAIEAIFVEIGNPSDSFDQKLEEAIHCAYPTVSRLRVSLLHTACIWLCAAVPAQQYQLTDCLVSPFCSVVFVCSLGGV